ncbi:diguanylate cyclase [Archangium sp.]|uniref:diguanylate cyclase n=1 Tax=Archangium sp. TaxID=1872627 RepID=UPI002D6DFB75|nr:diguanylate cyclase [Archangium sp.]HYO56934.1 diguanylate cyclase [Archangium sp.]
MTTPVDVECCIVQIHGPELGKKYALQENELTIGREEGNHVVVDLDNVSRRHARILRKQGRMFVQDRMSTNGTYLNDQEVMQETPLRSGDLIKVGGSIFKFLTGDNVELQYHETIYMLAIVDGLTGVNNKRYFLEYLEREMGRCHRYGRPLTLMMLDIDFFKKINDVHGHLAGDYVLRELAQTIKRMVRKEQCFARYGGEEFSLVIPEDGADKVRIFAERLRRTIEEKQFVFESQEIPVTLSLGMADMTPDTVEPLQLIKVADTNLYKAKKGGRNQVVATLTPGSLPPASLKSGSSDALTGTTQQVREPRRHIDGMALVRRNLDRSPPGPVLAFEVADERTIIDLLGASGFERWTFELEQEVEEAIGPADLLGSWRDRYILAALEVRSHEDRAHSVVDAVRTAWAARPVPDVVSGRLTRSLRAAVLPPDSVVATGERCLDRLAVQLLDDAGRAVLQDARSDLPFPLAAPRALVLAQRTAFTRFKAIVDALESSLRFVVALELALLRDGEHAEARDKAAGLIASHTGRPLALGTWEELAIQLAALLPRSSSEPVMGALRSLVRNDGQRSALSERVREAVHERDRLIGQGITLSDDAYREQEEVFGKLLDEFLKLLEPLKQARLVSVAEIESLEADDDSVRYALYGHQGATEHFPIGHESIEARLAREWCYLLVQGRALCLAPVVAARTCESCGRVEVFLAEGLWLGPKGTEARVRGVTSNHNASIRVPFDSRARLFFEAVKAVTDREILSSTAMPTSSPPPHRKLTVPAVLTAAPAAVSSSTAVTKLSFRAALPPSSPPSTHGPTVAAPVTSQATPPLPTAVPTTPLIPAELRAALIAGRVIPFVGAGASMAVMDATRPGTRLFPSWGALLELVAQRLDAEGLTGDAMAVRGTLAKKVPNYLDAARAAREGLGPTWYKVLGEVFDPPRSRALEESLALPRAIWEFGSKLLVTTNYDRVLHWTCPERDDLRSWDIEAPAEFVKLLRNDLDYPTIWHLHGTIANAAGLILTPDGYSRLYSTNDAGGAHYEAALTSLRVLLASHTLLFVGFSFEDTTFGDQLRWLEETFRGAGGPHYVLVREAERDRMRARLQGLPLELLTYADHGKPLVARVRELAAVCQQRPMTL